MYFSKIFFFKNLLEFLLALFFSFQCKMFICHLLISVQSLSHVWLFATTWTAVQQASLSIVSSQSLLKLMSIELVMPSKYLILCRPLLLLSLIFPSIRVFSNESTLHIRWQKYWNFSLGPSNEYPLPFLNPAFISGSSWFTYCWSLAWRILSITLLACEMSAIVQ